MGNSKGDDECCNLHMQCCLLHLKTFPSEQEKCIWHEGMQYQGGHCHLDILVSQCMNNVTKNTL